MNGLVWGTTCLASFIIGAWLGFWLRAWLVKNTSDDPQDSRAGDFRGDKWWEN